VNLAINRAALANRFGGQLSTPSCQVLPPSFPGHDDYCPWTRGRHDGHWHGSDVQRARRLVGASGTKGATVEFVTRSGDLTGPLAATPLISALRRIGYHPRAVVLEGEQFERRINAGGWNMSAGDWTADYPSPGEFLDYFLSCSNYRPQDGHSTNSGGFCSPDFDRLVARAESTQLMDPGGAQRIWARADRFAVDQAAWAPIANTPSADVLSRRTGNFTLDANSQPRIDQLWVR
jgi:peptide/nickel transport system substrate-binding protein